MTPLVGNRVVIVNACHFYSSGCTIFEIFVKPHALLAWYLANTIEIFGHINTGGCQHAKDQCSSKYIWVKKAVGFLQRCPNLKVPEAMKLAHFTPQEIACKARWMWIYWQWNKLTQRNVIFATPPPQRITFATNSNNSINEGGSLSSVTDSGSIRPLPKKKIKLTCTTAQAKQTNRTAWKQKEEQNKKAFKHATIWYAPEKFKEGRMSAESVVTHVNKELNMKLSRRTVAQFVQEGKLATHHRNWVQKVAFPSATTQTFAKRLKVLSQSKI